LRRSHGSKTRSANVIRTRVRAGSNTRSAGDGRTGECGMNPKRCSEYPALGALFLSFALARLSPGCAGTEESQTGVGSNTNPEDCVSAVSWYGALESSAETLVLQGCVNDECRTRTVDVDPSAQCKVKREWTNDWGSGACANVLEPSVVQVVFQLDL